MGVPANMKRSIPSRQAHCDRQRPADEEAVCWTTEPESGTGALKVPVSKLATVMAALTVAWMKSWTNVHCPWDLADFGGDRRYHGLFATRPAGRIGRCFPAGHASAGYCWLSLYFFFLATRPRLRWLGFGVAMGFGLLLGFVQQLRGAHFLSHDLWALAVCWLFALALYVIVLKPSAD